VPGESTRSELVGRIRRTIAKTALRTREECKNRTGKRADIR
jgi:hypothetical protein